MSTSNVFPVIRRCVVLIALLPALYACESGPVALAPDGNSMGTTWHARLLTDTLSEASLHKGIQGVLDRIETRMSTYRKDSELSRFNASRSTDWFPVSAETARVVAEALRIARLSGGAFDITVAPLVDMWGFGPDFHLDRIPVQSRIEAALAHTGYKNLEIRGAPPALRKRDPLTQIDLSGIAKGYAVDAVASYLRQAGLRDFMIEVGGEVYAAGHNASAQAWRIAVERPRDEGRAIERVVGLSDQGMATSGDYRNYFYIAGVRYSHTIDPRTGWPVRHHLASATVLHASTMSADALATAMLVLGRQRGLELARREALAVLLIGREAQGLREYASAAFRRRQQGSRDTGE